MLYQFQWKTKSRMVRGPAQNRIAPKMTRTHIIQNSTRNSTKHCHRWSEKIQQSTKRIRNSSRMLILTPMLRRMVNQSQRRHLRLKSTNTKCWWKPVVCRMQMMTRRIIGRHRLATTKSKNKSNMSSSKCLTTMNRMMKVVSPAYLWSERKPSRNR